VGTADVQGIHVLDGRALKPMIRASLSWLEYGARISSVAHSIKQVVKYQVEKALELPVVEVNVHVHALRVSDFE
jgi:uncharacterized alkaline shock family protein YloU